MDPKESETENAGEVVPPEVVPEVPVEPTPEVVPETPAPAEPAAPAGESQPVENGVGMGNQFASVVEALAWMVKAVEAEETAEGDSQAIPAELRAAVKGLVEPVKAYQAKQLDELMPEEVENSDFDIDDADEFTDLADLPEDDGSDIVENGDYPGHPFRGNQHTGGKRHSGRSKTGRSGASSKLAHRASVAAHSGGSKEHRKAAMAHKSAHMEAAAAGRKKVAAYHKAQMEHHRSMTKIMNNADVDTKPATPVVDLSPLEAIIKTQGEQIAALTQKIENADTKPARNRPYMAGSVVLRDPIENADVEKTVEEEVQRIASLPPEQVARELIASSLRASMGH